MFGMTDMPVNCEVKVHKGVAADEHDSDSQGLGREAQARRRGRKIVALRTGI